MMPPVQGNIEGMVKSPIFAEATATTLLKKVPTSRSVTSLKKVGCLHLDMGYIKSHGG